MVFDSQLGEREGHIALYVEPLIYIYPFHRALETISSLYRALSLSLPCFRCFRYRTRSQRYGAQNHLSHPHSSRNGSTSDKHSRFFPFWDRDKLFDPIIPTGPVCFCNPDRIVYGCDSDLTLGAIDIFRPALRSASLVKLLLFFSA